MARRIAITNGRILETRTIYSLFSPDVDVQVSSSADLLFPTATGKPYYQVGDMVLTANLEARILARMYKGFETDTTFSWGRFLMSMMDADKVLVAKRIEAIAGDGLNARVTMRPLMKVTDTDWVQLTTLSGQHLDVQSTLQFMASFSEMDMHDSLKIWIPISTTVAEIVTIPLGGSVKSGASALLKKLGPKAVKQILKWGGRKLATETAKKAAATAGKIAAKTAMDTAKAIAGKYHEQLRTDKVKGTNELEAKLQDIILSSLRDALAENVTDGIADLLLDLAPGWGGDELLTKPIKERITVLLTKRIGKIGLAPFTKAVKVVILSIPVGDKGSYTKSLAENIKKEASAWLSSESLGKEVGDALKDIVDQPELVIPSD